MFHGHGNRFDKFGSFTKELDCLSLGFQILDELLEPTPLNEEFNGIL
jgi:hypothetical protein